MALDDLSPEVMKRVVASCRDRQFAELVVMILGLAAETHGDLVRAALARVFDLSEVEKKANEMMARIQTMGQQSQHITDGIRRAEMKLEKLQTMLDAVDVNLEKQQKQPPPTRPAPNGSHKRIPGPLKH